MVLALGPGLDTYSLCEPEQEFLSPFVLSVLLCHPERGNATLSLKKGQTPSEGFFMNVCCRYC